MVTRGKALTVVFIWVAFASINLNRALKQTEAFCRNRLQERANAFQCGGELVGVVGGGHFELLEEGVDGGADFGGVGGFGVFAVGDVERIESHGGLFGGAFVGERNFFRVVGDFAHRAKRESGIVLHAGQTVGEALRDRSGGSCRCDNTVFVWIEFAHFRGDSG